MVFGDKTSLIGNSSSSSSSCTSLQTNVSQLGDDGTYHNWPLPLPPPPPDNISTRALVSRQISVVEEEDETVAAAEWTYPQSPPPQPEATAALINRPPSGFITVNSGDGERQFHNDNIVIQLGGGGGATCIFEIVYTWRNMGS